MFSNKEQDVKLESAIEYAKFEALPGLAVQILSALFNNLPKGAEPGKINFNIDAYSIIRDNLKYDK